MLTIVLDIKDYMNPNLAVTNRNFCILIDTFINEDIIILQILVLFDIGIKPLCISI